MSVQHSPDRERAVRASLPVHPDQTLEFGPYRLRVDGLVGRPLELSTEDLRAMPRRVVVDDFACREGWLVPGLRWRGVAVAELLAHAATLPEATWVQVSAGDFSLPLRLKEARGALVALELDGEPLTTEHGGPARLLVPGGECFTSLKRIDHIELQAEAGENSARRVALARLTRSDV